MKNIIEKIAGVFGYHKDPSIDMFPVNTYGSFVGQSPSPSNLSSYLKQYADVAWVYACVSIIASKVASVPMYVYKKKMVNGVEKLDRVPNHPLQSMLNTVNPFMDGFMLKESTASYLKLTGNAYWLLDMFKDGRPTEIYPLNPYKVKVIPHKTEYIQGYTYEATIGEPIKLPKENVIHFKEFNPNDDYYGLSPLAASLVSVDSLKYGDKYNRNFFLNSAMPAGQLTTAGQLLETQRKRIAESWKQAHTGYTNAHKTVILEGGVEWKSITPTHTEMMFPELKKMSREDVLGVFRVPPVMVGIFEYANYANAAEQRRIFWIDTIIPTVNRKAATINSFLVDPYDPSVTVAPDYSGVEALKDDEKLVAETNEIYVRSGIKTINEVRQGLKLKPVTYGETWNAPFGLSPIDSPEREEPPLPGGEEETEDEKILGPEQTHEKEPMGTQAEEQPKTAEEKEWEYGTKVWNMFKAVSESWERDYWPKLRKLFNEQEKEVIRNLNDSDFKSFSVQSKLDRFANFKDKTSSILFDGKKWRKEFRKMDRKQLEAALVDKANNEIANLNLDFEFDVKNDRVQEYLDSKSFEFADEVNKTTEESLRKELKEAVESGEGIKEVEKRIERIFDMARDYRTKRIARTEMISALNKGALESYNQSGVVEKKKWVSSRDGEVRDSHRIDSDPAVPIDKKFSNGLEYPGDTAGGPGEVVNCRCTIIAVIPKQ